MTNIIDQYLLFRIRTKRDPQAFGRLYDRYVTSIYRFVFLKLPSKETAEDVTSETFLRCWQFIVRSNDVANIRAFLYRIARNLVADTYRQRGSTPTIPLDVVTFLPPDASTDSTEDISDRRSGQRLIEARVDLELVLEKIARLKEDYQDVLTLRLIDGLAFGDIAKILEKEGGHVRVIYHRAMKALDGLLKEST